MVLSHTVVMFPCIGSRFAQLELTVPFCPHKWLPRVSLYLYEMMGFRGGLVRWLCFMLLQRTHTILRRHRRQPAVTVVTSSSSLMEQDVSNEGGVSGIRVFRVYERAVCSRMSRGPHLLFHLPELWFSYSTSSSSRVERPLRDMSVFLPFLGHERCSGLGRVRGFGE